MGTLYDLLRLSCDLTRMGEQLRDRILDLNTKQAITFDYELEEMHACMTSLEATISELRSKAEDMTTRTIKTVQITAPEEYIVVD